MNQNLIAIACEMLECGVRELDKLEDIGEDMMDILFELELAGEKTTFDNIQEAAIKMNIEKLNEALQARIEELESEEELIEEEEQELETLYELDPENDVEYYAKGIDTSCYISDTDKVEAYNEYLKDALEDFEYNTGYNPAQF